MSKTEKPKAPAAGNLTPAQASAMKHHADSVLGKCDSKYHNTGK